MHLTPEQIVYINKEREVVNRILMADPGKGYLRYAMRQEAIQLIIAMHNIENNKRNEANKQKNWIYE